MKSTNAIALHFFARRLKAYPQEAVLFLRITVNRERLEISLKRKVPFANWDAHRSVIKGNKKLAAEIDTLFDDVRDEIKEVIRQLKANRKIITAQLLKRSYLEEDAKGKTLCDLLRYHKVNMKTVLAPGTLKNYGATERYLTFFLEKRYRIKDIELALLNYQFIIEFEFFLRTTSPLAENNPLSNNGIMKHMERLRKMVTLAAKMEWIPKDPFQQYSLKFQKVDKPFLTDEELMALETKELKFQKLHLARDLFVFSCYTGLAYVDLMALQPSHLCIGFGGNLWLKTARKKTEVSVNIPLLNKANLILEKYRNDPRSTNKSRLFPRLSNQKMNAYLKQIAHICEITKPFSFHTARHTFATTVTLANGVPIETVSKMLGHTKLSTTQIYARVLERKVSEDMNQLKQKLEGAT